MMDIELMDMSIRREQGKTLESNWNTFPINKIEKCCKMTRVSPTVQSLVSFRKNILRYLPKGEMLDFPPNKTKI